MKLVPVEGYDGLARDIRTGAILNINSGEVDKARERKAKQRQQQRDLEAMQQDIDQMKYDLKVIKDLLLKVTEK